MLFYPIDIDDSSEGILLFGITEDGRREKFIDSSYRPYFLVLPSDKKKAAAEIEKKLSGKNPFQLLK